jgi:hypothetical protein
MEMRQKRVFAVLNYSGVYAYCRDALRFSEAQAYYFKSVAEKAEEIPQIQEAVVQGELTLSQARRIVPVVTPENLGSWIEKAQSLSQKDLEREVKAVNPRAHIRESLKPITKELSELRVPVDTETEDALTVLSDILAQKFQRPVSRAEIVAFALKQCRERLDPEKKALRAKVISSGKPLPAPGRRPVRISVRHEVVRRHGNQCSFVGSDGRRCSQKRWLALHHKREVAHGGLNTAENLQPLCHAHHALVHQRRL